MSDDDLSIPDFLRRRSNTPAPVVAASTPEQKHEPEKFVSSFSRRSSPRRSANIDGCVRHMLMTTEGMIDDVMYEGATPSSVYDALIALDAPTTVGRSVVNKYSGYLEELKAIGPGCDPQLAEGYAGWKREDINKLIDLVSAIVDEAARYVGNKRAVRPSRPWKARQPKAQRQIRDLKYLRENAELKLVSLDPMKVIGAMTLWTYDVKRRMLCMYVSNSRSGFIFRGTTLKNIDREQSVAKKLRWPEEQLQQILSSSKSGAVSFTQEIKTKGAAPNGRINNNTILLRSQ